MNIEEKKKFVKESVKNLIAENKDLKFKLNEALEDIDNLNSYIKDLELKLSNNRKNTIKYDIIKDRVRKIILKDKYLTSHMYRISFKNDTSIRVIMLEALYM